MDLRRVRQEMSPRREIEMSVGDTLVCLGARRGRERVLYKWSVVILGGAEGFYLGDSPVLTHIPVPVCEWCTFANGTTAFCCFLRNILCYGDLKH